MPKGILKKGTTSQDEKVNRLKWDEDSLLLTEAQKDSKMKINEPKTPFVHSNPADELEDDLEEMSLSASSPHKSPRMAASEHRVHISSGSEWEEDEDLPMTEEEKEKHRQFVKMRSNHYNMKEAFVRPSDMEELEDDNDDNGNNNNDDDDDDNETTKFVGAKIPPKGFSRPFPPLSGTLGNSKS
ncbi:hypothetical protein H4R33_000489 [Dimargaris cristalligena]|uniref:Protein phosphatase inhibitor 2 n=1 Tax=Dimargaris cristalligena TaxID=215637 RepID=A0A4P9ZVW9_9FUNG|nr:hypothetical protein H4R33_000489 [Dimargaris cristalligena]RKP37428.1 hypothetical protein BJ085DRAFT_40188 [Dimargaris cristalligena]|eukprot:RKP37428.1 hypothetical protein BJ085DRAFT_40188 [Dimargaris cristalligena]